MCQSVAGSGTERRTVDTVEMLLIEWADEASYYRDDELIARQYR